jgi:hypothetical protein
METTHEVPLVAPPPIPSKWDIIPIHASDVASFLRCRRYWSWSSPAKLNLRRRVDIAGINFPLWYGSGIHYALEMYYDPFLSRDPIESFNTWYEYQMNGGIVTTDWLERLYDNHPHQREDGLWEVRGLREIHPDPIMEDFEKHYDLGIGMLTFYKEYAAREDRFVVVAAEAMFSVPLGFEAIDRREDSPNYGKMVEVHARGKRDGIAFNPFTALFGLIDHKTAAAVDEEYFTKLEMDPQCKTYTWAAQEEAKIHDLPYKRIHGVIYNVLAKKYPRLPTILKDGISPSVNRKDESTTAELFMQYVQEAGIMDLYNLDTKWQAYYNWLTQMGDKQYIWRETALYNEHEIRNHGLHLKMVAKEMLRDDLQVYPTPSGNWLCTKCQFRAPCLAADDGSDYVYMLADGYEENKGR